MKGATVVSILLGVLLLLVIIHFVRKRCGREGFDGVGSSGVSNKGDAAYKDCINNADKNYTICKSMMIQNCDDLHNEAGRDCEMQSQMPDPAIHSFML